MIHRGVPVATTTFHVPLFDIQDSPHNQFRRSIFLSVIEVAAVGDDVILI
jgi:hypothetical protein